MCSKCVTHVGDWMEFGVAYAATINMAAEWRERTCGHCPFVHGFDTFTGLKPPLLNLEQSAQ